MRKIFFATIIPILFLFNTHSLFATGYITWLNNSGGTWSGISNWSGGNIPSNTDTARFNDGGTYTVTLGGSISIAKIIVSNNTTVTIDANGATRNWYFTAGTNEALLINAGSSLIVSGSLAQTLTFTSTCGGNIYGTIKFTGAGHTTKCYASNPLYFKSGSIFYQSSTGYPFNSNSTYASGVVFESGSKYYQQSGSNPFGLTQPSSCVVFQSGSKYIHQQATQPSTSGRTFGDFEWDVNSTQSVAGSATLLIDNLTVLQGSLTFGMTGNFQIKKDINISAGGTLIFSPASESPVLLTGSTTQTISNAGTLSFGTYQLFTVNNSSGIVLNASINIPDVINIAEGSTITVNPACTLATASSVTNSGTLIINGAFQINSALSASGNNFAYGASGGLIFNSATGYTVKNTDISWPTVGGPNSVTVLQGALTMNSGSSRTVGGVLQTASAITNANLLTINGTLKINSGGSCAAAPVYGSTSTLIYNTGSSFNRGAEWYATNPKNVQVSNNTSLRYTTAGTQTQTITGDLTIDSGSSLLMDYGSASIGVLIIGGSVLQNGNLSLGASTEGNLYVGKNYTKGAGTLNTNSRMVRFNGATTQTISGSPTFSYLTIANTSGEVTLGSDVTVTNTLDLISGAVITGSNTLIANSLVTRTSGFVIGALKKTSFTGSKTFEVGDANGYTPVDIVATGTGDFTIKSVTGRQPNATGFNALNEYWTLSNGTGITSADLIFHYLTAEVNGSETNYTIAKYSASSWAFPTTTLNTIAKTASVSGITTFGDFTIGESTSLPVELSAFTASAISRNVTLNWNTATEVNSAKFIVEKKSSGNWSSIGQIVAAGNSNSPKSYIFTDKNLTTGKYSYRLKMVDNDGTFGYSKVAEAIISAPTEFSLSQNYPNPFNPSTMINFDLPADAQVKLELFSVTGAKVATILNSNMSAGYNSAQLNMNSYGLSSGVYFYKLTATEAGSNKVFTQTKKLVYLK